MKIEANNLTNKLKFRKKIILILSKRNSLKKIFKILFNMHQIHQCVNNKKVQISKSNDNYTKTAKLLKFGLINMNKF